MTEIEKMRRYIERTHVKYPELSPYSLKSLGMREMMQMCKEGDSFGALFLAFEYGRAKGERHARAGARKRAAK